MRSYGPTGRLTWWLLAALALAPATSACERASAPEPSAAWPDGLARPTSMAEVAALRAAGAVWTDTQVRRFYLDRVAEIGPADAALAAGGDTVESRARTAFTSRRDARMIARAMMQDPAEVEVLRSRDRAKYGHPDGPTFEHLVERAGQKGLTGDAVFASIIDSAQVTAADR